MTTYGGVPNQLRAGAAAVIFDTAGRLLLQQRGDNGDWGLPGGADETLALGWFAPDALPAPFVPNHISRVQDAVARQTAAFIR